MLLWISFAVLSAAVVTLLLRPLRGVADESVAPAAADVAVYKDQLAELEAERERGLISEEEMESARSEVARRLLKRADSSEVVAAPANDIGSTDKRVNWIYQGLAAAIPVLAVGFYLLSGSPHLPDRPLAQRISEPVQQATIADVIARIEDRLRTHPDDGQGWDVVAPVYLKLGRYGDAAHAYAEANRLLGESTNRLLGFAEATLLAERGVVTEPVRKAAARVLELEPDRIEPKIWLALLKEQDGQLEAAMADFQGLLSSAPAEAPYRDALSERIEVLRKRIAGEPVAETPAGGAPQAPTAPSSSGSAPGGVDAGAVANMTPEERAKFVGQMVDGLAARLKTDGKDLAGWLRLMRAYKVLGREQEAVAASTEARRNFAGDQKSLEAIDELAKSLGIGS